MNHRWTCPYCKQAYFESEETLRYRDFVGSGCVIIHCKRYQENYFIVYDTLECLNCAASHDRPCSATQKTRILTTISISAKRSYENFLGSYEKPGMEDVFLH